MRKFNVGDKVNHYIAGVMGIVDKMVYRGNKRYSYVVKWDDDKVGIHHERDLTLVDEPIMDVDELFKEIVI